jgi:hypothetical protein
MANLCLSAPFSAAAYSLPGVPQHIRCPINKFMSHVGGAAHDGGGPGPPHAPGDAGGVQRTSCHAVQLALWHAPSHAAGTLMSGLLKGQQVQGRPPISVLEPH